MSDRDHTVTLEEWVNGACGAVVEAMGDGSEERRAAVAQSIADVAVQLPAELGDLRAFLQALQELLAGDPPAKAGEQLGESYAPVFARVVDAVDDAREPRDHHELRDHIPHQHDHPAAPEGRRMGLGDALDEIVRDTLRVMRQGNRADRAQMAQGLELLRLQAQQAMEWPAFAQFLAAIQHLLREEGIESADFEPPFDQAWAKISEQL